MPSLRTLLSDQSPANIGNPNKIFYVKTFSTGASNGGQCCLWTVPAGITRVTFEMWGAGGTGQGARCCERAGAMPTAGSYARISTDTTEGTQYTICAGGSGDCNGCCGVSPRANPSYARVNGGAMVGCAVGGCGGCSEMTRGGFCYGYICCWAKLSGTGLGDVVMDGAGGISVVTCHCNTDIHTINSGGWSSDKKSSSFCAKEPSGSGPYMICNPPSYPSGAGSPARACGGGYCHGQHGAAGVVKISYT